MSTQRLPVLATKKTITIGGEEIKIHEMAWPDAMEFLRLLGKHAGELLDDKGQVPDKFQFPIDKVVELVTNVTELSEHLMVKSIDKDKEWIAALSFGEAIDLLDGALEINLSEELMAKVKKLLGRFATALGVTTRKKTSPAQSTS